MPEDSVRVIVPDTGSGYGGKHTGDAAIEAARLAKRAGKPVKLVWTREEEFTWAYFRPAGVIDIAGAVRGDGTITGVGISQLQLRRDRRSAAPTISRDQRSEFHQAALAAQARFVSRARLNGQCLRPRDAHG